MADDITIQSPTPIVATTNKLTRWSKVFDTSRRYVTDGPTAESLANILQDIDQGDIGQMMELNEEMEAKDAHLFGVATTRRRSVTALNWRIEPAETGDQQQAAEAAAYCQELLDDLDDFEESLEHWSTAIGPNLAVSELLWQKSELVGIIDVPGHRLWQETYFDALLRMRTDENIWPGEDLPAGKFVVYTPDCRAGFPFRVTMMRAGAWLYLLKHFVKSDWAAFSELFGIPFRVGKVPMGTPDGVRSDIADMLRDMSADGWAMIPSDAEVDMINTGGQGSPHQGFIDWIEKKQSILYLGQTLTTDTGGVGSLALGRVHDNVRTDLTVSDLKKEARMVRRQVLRPMVRLRFPKGDVPVPVFVREVHEEKNIEAARLSMDQIAKGQELGLQLDQSFLYKSLDIPEPTPDVTVDEDGNETEVVEDDS